MTEMKDKETKETQWLLVGIHIHIHIQMHQQQ
jgi:hypothetical protein